MMSHMGSSPLRKGGWGVPFLWLAAQAYRQLLSYSLTFTFVLPE